MLLLFVFCVVVVVVVSVGGRTCKKTQISWICFMEICDRIGLRRTRRRRRWRRWRRCRRSTEMRRNFRIMFGKIFFREFWKVAVNKIFIISAKHC